MAHREGFLVRPIWAALVLALVVGTAAPRGLAAQLSAEGHAQVVAQGVAPMPRAEVGWRVLGMEARPLGEAPATERSLGFVLADGGALLVTDETSGTRTLLNPGEAVLAQQGVTQTRASLDDDPASYYAVELVVAVDLENEATIGSGALLFAGDPFEAPQGDRDLDLVRDVLDDGEDGELTTDAPAIVLVTEGEVSVSSDDEDATLVAGEAGVFTGEIELEGGDDGGVYVAAVIGERVPEAEGGASDDEPFFSVTTYACPAGMRFESLETDECAPSDESLIEWELSGDELDETLTTADAEVAGPATVWSDLPAGDYFVELTAVDYAAGYDDYFVPSSDQVTRIGEQTTQIFYQSDGFSGSIRAYVFPTGDDSNGSDEPVGEGAVVLLVESCPPGTTLPDIQVTPCDHVLDGFAVELSGDGLDAPLTESDSGAGDAVFWGPLPFGTYTITFTALPDGHDVFYVFGQPGASVHELGDGTGYTFELDAEVAAADPYFDDAGTIQLTAVFVDSEG